MSRSKVVIQQVVSLDGEITVEAKEDVSEAPSNGDDSSLEISIKKGKAHIRSSGFKVVKKESKSKGGNNISIKATSSGKVGGAAKVSVTTNTSNTKVSEVLDKELDKLDKLLEDLDDW